jgi:hypothetical protein
MSLLEFLQSHDLARFADRLAAGGYTEVPHLRRLVGDDAALRSLGLGRAEENVLVESLQHLPCALPTLLALPLAEFERQQPSPVLALWAAADFVEAVLKFCVTAAVAEHGSLPEKLRAALFDHVKRPTLGDWFKIADAASKCLPEASVLEVLPATVEALRRLLGIEREGAQHSFHAVRIRLAHGGPIAAKEARALYNLWAPRVREFANNELAWLERPRLIAVNTVGQHFLCRGNEPEACIDVNPVPSDAPAGSGWLCVGEKALDLGPIAAFEPDQRTPLLYFRCGDVVLEYIRYGRVGFHQSTKEDADRFRDKFLVPSQTPSARKLKIPGFEAEIRETAKRCIGRQREIETLHEAVLGCKTGSIWVGAPPGTGKSVVMARLMERLLDDPPQDVLVLPYRFSTNDRSDRNSRTSFLIYLRERLEGTPWLSAAPTPGDEPGDKESNKSAPNFHVDPFSEVRELLSQLKEGARLLLVVDGLDEIAEREPRFVEDVLFRLGERVGLVAAGRPELGLPESFRKRGAIEPFPGGLPPMSSPDIRAMLLERLGPLRKRLLELDEETGATLLNPFVEQVVQLSDGLPAYITLLLGDLTRRPGMITLEAELPRGLQEYHRELVRRSSLGDRHMLKTQVLVLLAVALEPLSAGQIQALLNRTWDILPPMDLVAATLTELEAMLRSVSNSESETGYRLYHDSFRAEVVSSGEFSLTIPKTRAALAEAALHPAGDAAEHYLYRNGVRHLLDQHRFQDAIRVTTDFELLMTRFRALDATGIAADGWYADWELLLKPGEFEGEIRVWRDFARTNRHHFRKEGWEAWRVLFQAAMDHADNSPVTMEAERFYAEGKAKWTWLRCVNRPKEWVASPVVAVLDGHKGRLIGVKTLNDGRILSWSADQTIRVWNLTTGECELMFRYQPFGQLEHCAGVNIKEISGNRVIIIHVGSVHVHCLITGSHLAELKCHASNAIQIAFGKIITYGGDYLRVWDEDTYKCVQYLRGHNDFIENVKPIDDFRIVSWARDGELRLWDVSSGKSIFAVKGHLTSKSYFTGPINGAIQLRSGNLLSWGKDPTLRLWSLANGTCLQMLEGHTSEIRGVLEISQSLVLSWCYNGCKLPRQQDTSKLE